MCGGAAFALSIMDGRLKASEADPMPPAGMEEMESCPAPAAPAPWAEVEAQAEADHFDTGDDGQYSVNRYDYPEDSSGAYDRAEGNFAYPEEYFYKYGYHYYNYVDPEGKYGYHETGDTTDANADAATTAETDRIGEIGNSANYSHERDWENEPYEFGDGTTAQLYEVANGLVSNFGAWDSYDRSPYGYDYGSESSYGDEYGMGHSDTAYPYGYEGDTDDDEAEYTADENADGEMMDEAEYEYTGDENADGEMMDDEAQYEYDDENYSYEAGMEEEGQGDAGADESVSPENDAHEEPAEESTEETTEPSGEMSGDQAASETGDASVDHYGYERYYGMEEGYDGYSEDYPEQEYSYEQSYEGSYEESMEASAPATEEAPANVEEQDADETAATESPESCYDDPNGRGYEYDYQNAYGYEEGYGEESASNRDEQQSWQEYGYEYSYPEQKYGYSHETSEMNSESESFEADESATGETSAPTSVDSALPEANHEAEYDFDSRYEGEPGELIDYSQWNQPYSYEYAEPYDYYGEEQSSPDESADETYEEHDYCAWPEGEEYVAQQSDESRESGLELFSWQPADLLATADQQLLRTLETLCEDPSGARRSVLNDHLEGMGFEAIDFASRFEDVTGMEALGLADDLPGAAAFLACFRLVEQGELGMDEAVDLLRRSLQSPSLDWIEGVRQITAGAFDDWNSMPASLDEETSESDDTTSAAPLSDIMASLVVRSLDEVQGTLTSLASRVSQWDVDGWLASLQERLAEAQMTSETATF